jgi:hypothetical protein
MNLLPKHAVRALKTDRGSDFLTESSPREERVPPALDAQRRCVPDPQQPPRGLPPQVSNCPRDHLLPPQAYLAVQNESEVPLNLNTSFLKPANSGNRALLPYERLDNDS